MTPAWRVAAALALACGLDWGRWARSRRPNPNCDLCWGRGGERDGDVPDQWYPCECLRPVADPFNVDAYLADCARRGVEPGPLPSLEYWDASTGVFFRVNAGVRIDIGGACWATITFDGAVHVATDGGGCEASNLALLSTLVTAAAAAVETTDD